MNQEIFSIKIWFPFSFAVGGLSTYLQCYFGCDESFKKDYQLHLHLKLKHRNEEPKELEKAYEAAEEEIALTRRSASIFNCALCPKTFNDNGAFYGHIQVRIFILDFERFGRSGRFRRPSKFGRSMRFGRFRRSKRLHLDKDFRIFLYILSDLGSGTLNRWFCLVQLCRAPYIRSIRFGESESECLYDDIVMH